MEKKEFYTPEEKLFIEGVMKLNAFEKMNLALKLDLLLLEIEDSLDMIDGRKKEDWLC